MTTIIGSILVVALVAFGAAFAVNKPFRTKVLQVLRIKSDQALDGATSAIDKERGLLQPAHRQASGPAHRRHQGDGQRHSRPEDPG